MPLVFASIVPHPPILIPSIGKENTSQLKKTLDSYNELKENLYASQAETVIIISPHGFIQNNAFTMNLSPEFEINFEEFGDFSTKKTINGDFSLGYKIREKLETTSPLQLISEQKLDHGSAVPMFLLAESFNLKIIPIYYSGLDLSTHFEFGKILQKTLQRENKRIAVIASGDMSHKLSKNSPAGFSPKAEKFDQKIINYIRNGNHQNIVNMDEKLIKEVGECGLKSIVTLLGIIDGIKNTPNILSYESPFGVGYMTVNFKF